MHFCVCLSGQVFLVRLVYTVPADNLEVCVHGLVGSDSLPGKLEIHLPRGPVAPNLNRVDDFQLEPGLPAED